MKHGTGVSGCYGQSRAVRQNSILSTAFAASARLPELNCRGSSGYEGSLPVRSATPLTASFNWIFLARWPASCISAGSPD